MKSFFFDDSELPAKPKTRRKRAGAGCDACGLHRHCESPKMKPHGSSQMGIVVVAEAPGKKEDETGIPLVGPAGKFLNSSMIRMGLDLDNDCVKLNVIQCRPTDKRGNNRHPAPEEILACRPRVDRQIKAAEPDLIFAFGTPAIAEILRDAPFSPNATTMHGRVVPSPKWGCWVACGLHPSWYLHGQNKKHWRRMDDVVKAGLKELDSGPYEDTRLDPAKYELVEDFDRAMGLMKEWENNDEATAFDYETNGFDPWMAAPRILTGAWATNPGHGWCIPFEHPFARWNAEQLQQLFNGLRRWLSSPCSKVIQNRQFEEVWSRVVLGTEIENVEADTMVMAHVLDNRPGVCSQQFQEFVRYGESGHKKMVNPARLEQEFLDTIARYTCLDVRYDIRIHHDQEREIENQTSLEK